VKQILIQPKPATNHLMNLIRKINDRYLSVVSPILLMSGLTLV